ncbi:hypothetical protein ACFYO2_28990 [Streptomyces sp. NPDC006602]|uniref:hypothetical protein n=1 Tax=Streptomyces sp. NPDC006602 TaxID=3364751 RepID=UPI0036A6B520
MTTIDRQAAFDNFRERMCDHLAAVSERTQRHLHVEQALLDDGTFFTHRLDGDDHHVVYDPQQISPLNVRQFLGIYVSYTEGRILDQIREAAYRFDTDGWRQFHEEVTSWIDRTQDPEGVIDQVLDLISSEQTEKSEARP